MNRLLVKIWRLIQGPLQWYVLWLAHDKFIVGTSAVMLNEQGQVLLLRHRYWREGSWGLPGGYANKSEKLEDAVCRELHEETGLSSYVVSLIRIVSGYKLRLEVSFFGYVTDGNMHLDSREVIEAKFFEPQELPLGLLQSHQEIIALALENKKID